MSNSTDKIIAEIRSDLKVLVAQFQNTDKKVDMLGVKMDKYEERLSTVESKQLVLDSKNNAIAVFQLIFSTALSAVVAFFGGRKG